ncbi:MULTISPECIES: MsnO8 family LLM class oxidoreductase [Prauserella salsuginis group]|uniref:MsnO8 family LLM class oxidoreductase n=1 Tax=Prauserella salsuginis TaxID=387889 RepID=A0ABW6FWI8_9PSEU|nr:MULTISPECIES: MsnO8 family LLM class oxidoreductase [Prauserella salsuginis group]MCR3720344.1 luciferase family oxidoreductase, group 1 [Prauserella flava]MCR3733947.1 luciferase family oxidoreductase, group 1 [Prauserella salsuginis]
MPLPPLSVLDRASVRHGQDPAAALRDTVRFAVDVEQLGYRRFWVAEHHGVPGIAGAAPTVLAAAVGAATSTIRVGTGGVMLPNHRPLVVAEQFGTLESLHPGRVDMGLGRSVGFTGAVRTALGADKTDAGRFGDDVRDLLGYFDGDHRVRGLPAEGLRPPPLFVLATGSGAGLAAELGAALVIAPLGDVDRLADHIRHYGETFRPSAQWPAPHVIVSTAAAVADSREQARELLLPEAWAMVRSRIDGVFPPLLPPGRVPTPGERERRYLDDALRGQIHGTESDVARGLTELVDHTGADELLITMSTHDRADMLDSYSRLANLT